MYIGANFWLVIHAFSMIRCGSTKESGFKLTKDNGVLHLQPFLCLYVPFLSLTSSVFPTFIFVFLARISTVLGVLWCWNNFLRELHYAWWRPVPTVLTDKKSIWWYGYIRSHTYVISIDWFSRSENNEKEFC